MVPEKELPVFGNEVEIDGVLYVSVDFLKQYPEYLDSELEQKAEGPESAEESEQMLDNTPSEHKSEICINGTSYIAVPALKAKPNYVEQKYIRKMDVSLEPFVLKNWLSDTQVATYFRRRRRAGS